MLVLRVVGLPSTAQGQALAVADADEEGLTRGCEMYMPAQSSFPHLERRLEMQGRYASVLPVQRRC